MQRAAAGDKQAWDALVEHYAPLVWRILGKFDNLTGTEKEDLSHDVFVILLDKGLQAFRGTTVYEFRAYLEMIAVNEAKSYLRRHGRRLEILDPFLVGEQADEESPLPDPFLRIAGDLPRRSHINPMVRSGLALAGANYASTVQAGDDGLLTALEISGMNLHGTDLVVLSACETAAGDVRVGEGVYGLRRAFALAGAKNLVMSLWPVGDYTTLKQMETFYKAHLTQGSVGR